MIRPYIMMLFYLFLLPLKSHLPHSHILCHRRNLGELWLMWSRYMIYSVVRIKFLYFTLFCLDTSFKYLLLHIMWVFFQEVPITFSCSYTIVNNRNVNNANLVLFSWLINTGFMYLLCCHNFDWVMMSAYRFDLPITILYHVIVHSTLRLFFSSYFSYFELP